MAAFPQRAPDAAKGSLCTFAEQLGMDSVCDRLETILDEEKEADELLSRLAEDTLNLEADTEES